MTLEALRVPEDAFGSLRGCLVEGDPQSEKRARRIKRRAVAISIALQTLALAALVLFPLLSKGERIPIQYVTPIPPYAPVGNHHASTQPPGQRTTEVCRICFHNLPPTISNHDPNPGSEADDPGGDIPGLLPSPGVTGGGIRTSQMQPVRPADETAREKKQRYVISEFQQMAQLVTRVEPIYPHLAIQTHREGRVELHAIISTEGRIESLEVISGDPFFIQSALSAVRQWRYRPTILDGRPVEIDTHITVIYTLSH